MLTVTLPWPPTVNTCAGIYRIDDIESGCFYIGSAVNLRHRFKHHVYCLEKGKHSNQRLQRIWAINPKRLVFSVITEMPGASREKRLAEEQKMLDASLVGRNKQCLNMLAIAGSHQGAKRSEETKARLSASQRGRRFSDETKEKMRAAKVGKKLSDEHRRKLSVINRGRKGPIQTKETIEKFRVYAVWQVLKLRELVACGKTVSHAAQQAGIKRATARRIVNGESYKEVQ